MSRLNALIAVLATVLVATAPLEAQENWPQWRGPAGNGVSEAEGLPTQWAQTENVVWSTQLPSWSGGTPVIWGDRIFVTSPSKADPSARAEPAEQSRQGRRRRRGGDRDPGGELLLLICLSKSDGRELWRHQLDGGNQLHLKHNNTSPSPVTDGEHVWVVTGAGVVTALDMEGKRIWRRELEKEYGPLGMNFGYASSPVLHEGRLILQVLHGQKTDEPSYVVAFDALTGKVVWRQERPTDAVAESPDAYTTPALLKHGGKTQIVVSGGDYVTGHDHLTGREVWRAGGLNPEKQGNYRVVGSPFVVGDMIYAPTRKRPLLALRAGGSGKITDSHLVWKWEGAGAPDVPTPVSDGKYFYMVDDKGLATCLSAVDGTVIWGPERTAQGTVSASPILADGKVYFINENAVTTVLSAGAQFEVLATNELDGSYTLSSPAVSGSRLFLRTGTHLYCLEQSE
jgi:outer membrane protein assembly factor BamB